MSSPSSHPRRNRRIKVGLPVLLKFGWKGSEEMKGAIVDISERGMCVRCHAPLRLGSEVEVVFESEPDNSKSYKVARVQDSDSEQHTYDIGLDLKP